jgi:phage FluMu protein Com
MLENESIPQIVKCSHCNKLFTQENFESHVCDLRLKECKRIDVVNFHDDSYKDKKRMTGWGTDGVLYTFEVVPRKPIPVTIPLADEKKHHFKTDGEEPVP